MRQSSFAERLPALVAVLHSKPLAQLARIPGATFKGLLQPDASKALWDAMLSATLHYICDHSASGDTHGARLGWKLLFVLPHLALPEPPKHKFKSAKRAGRYDPRRVRGLFVHSALVATHSATPAQLEERVDALLARFDNIRPRAERRTTTRDEQLEKTRLLDQVQRVTASNEMGKATTALDALTALAEQRSGTVRAGLPMLVTPTLLQDLRDLHPARAPLDADPPRPAGSVPAFQPTPKQVLGALKSFKRSTGLGPSGMPVNALVSVARMDGETESDSLMALTRIVSLVLRGDMSHDVCEVLTSARLVALTKASGAPRPIACGEVLRRLAAKCVVFDCRDRIGALLRPTQRGVGVKGGAEQLAHIVTSLLQANPGWVALGLDISNAFNTVFRGTVCTETLRHLPQLYELVQACYGGAARPFLWLDAQEFLRSLTGTM